MLIAAIAIVVTAVCSMFLFYQILEEQIFDDLKASAHVVSVISPNELSKDITYSLENDGLRVSQLRRQSIPFIMHLEKKMGALCVLRKRVEVFIIWCLRCQG